jgi:hypothetical protein
MMDWKISVGKAGASVKSGKIAGVAASKPYAAATTRLTGAQWSFTQNTDRTASTNSGSTSTWQAQRIYRHVLSTLVGFD